MILAEAGIGPGMHLGQSALSGPQPGPVQRKRAASREVGEAEAASATPRNTPVAPSPSWTTGRRERAAQDRLHAG
jgi:hypothetical protein